MKVKKSSRSSALRNTIHSAECTRFMASMPENSVDMVLTSPPYDDLRDYEGFVLNVEDIAKHLYRIIKPGGVVVWVSSDQRKKGFRTLSHFRQALVFQDVGFGVEDAVVYAKRMRLVHKNHYTPSWEIMLVLCKGKPVTHNILSASRVSTRLRHYYTDRNKDGSQKRKYKVQSPVRMPRPNIWAYTVGTHHSTNDDFAFEHPAIFPEALARDHILSWSNPGDLVLDPMCGSGTTLKMARLYGRDYVGIDISRKYTDIARRRVSNVKPILTQETVLDILPDDWMEAMGIEFSRKDKGA